MINSLDELQMRYIVALQCYLDSTNPEGRENCLNQEDKQQIFDQQQVFASLSTKNSPQIKQYNKQTLFENLNPIKQSIQLKSNNGSSDKKSQIQQSLIVNKKQESNSPQKSSSNKQNQTKYASQISPQKINKSIELKTNESITSKSIVKDTPKGTYLAQIEVELQKSFQTLKQWEKELEMKKQLQSKVQQMHKDIELPSYNFKNEEFQQQINKLRQALKAKQNICVHTPKLNTNSASNYQNQGYCNSVTPKNDIQKGYQSNKALKNNQEKQLQHTYNQRKPLKRQKKQQRETPLQSPKEFTYSKFYRLFLNDFRLELFIIIWLELRIKMTKNQQRTIQNKQPANQILTSMPF